MDDSNGRGARPTAPPPWKGTASLEPVRRLNERCLELLQYAASQDGADAPRVLTECREMWVGLDAAARQRLATLPFVIMDVEFKNEAWWRVARDGGEARSSPTEPGYGLPRDVHVILVHELILFAWQVAGTDRTVAQLLFGMSASVAQIVAALNSQQVRAITTQADARLQLRWADDWVLWRDMLTAAAARDEGKLAEIQLQTKVRFCSELAA